MALEEQAKYNCRLQSRKKNIAILLNVVCTADKSEIGRQNAADRRGI